MSSRPATPQFLLIPLMIALGSGLALMLLLLAVQPIISLVIAAVMGGVALAGRRIGLDVPGTLRRWVGAVLAWDDVTYEPLSRRMVALEMVVIVVMVALATYRFYTAPGLQLSGGEAEWLTSSAYAAHDGLREYGRIPLWQPLLESGETLVDNPFSFILNPFSSLPSLIVGAAEGAEDQRGADRLGRGVGRVDAGARVGIRRIKPPAAGAAAGGQGQHVRHVQQWLFSTGLQSGLFPLDCGGNAGDYSDAGQTLAASSVRGFVGAAAVRREYLVHAANGDLCCGRSRRLSRPKRRQVRIQYERAESLLQVFRAHSRHFGFRPSSGIRRGAGGRSERGHLYPLMGESGSDRQTSAAGRSRMDYPAVALRRDLLLQS